MARVTKKYSEKIQMLREQCEEDLFTFAQYVNPGRYYGEIHKKLFKFFSKEDSIAQLALIPRDHQKSHIIAVWCAWHITKNPWTTIIYMSATADLAEKQLGAIKNILTSDEYSALWPNMINKQEGKRAKWSASEMAVDHVERKKRGIRDMTVTAAGLTTNITGLHANVIIADDVVVPKNAYTAEGRRQTEAAMSQAFSVLTTGGIIKGVGTRYHPKDIYNTWRNVKMQDFDDEGNVIGENDFWEIMEEVVERNGIFLWPRAETEYGSFGFDHKQLAIKKAGYTDRTQFYAQYYNNPNDESTNMINRSKFDYYDKSFIRNLGNRYYFKEKLLNIYAAIDFAYTTTKRSDYTAIAVVGIDEDGIIYILDLERFKTSNMKDYFDNVAMMHSKWNFNKLRAEITAAQSLIVKDLKDEITRNGMILHIDEHKPTRHQGKKEERISSILDHRYQNGSIKHYKGGFTEILEDELVMAKPPHDDLKDALASAIEIAVKPLQNSRRYKKKTNVIKFNKKFGGRG